MTDTIHERAKAAGCPVNTFDFSQKHPLGTNHAQAARMRQEAPIWMSSLSQGFWLMSDHEVIRDMLQSPAIFSSTSITPQHPEQGFIFYPGNQDPPDHKKYRAFLNPWFSPNAVRGREDRIRAIARSIVERIHPNGQEDVANGYCHELATTAFLDMVGLPLEDAPQFMTWVDAFMRGFAGEEAVARGDGTQPEFDAAVRDVAIYMQTMLEDRRKSPRDPETDMFTALLNHRVDGRLLTQEELDGYTLLLFTGGLDTTRAQMSWLFYRLATAPEDRKQVIDHVDLVPRAVEESLRLNTIVFAGRKIMQDVTWHGVELRAGDMAWAILNSANRDPELYEDADKFIVDRDAAPNMGFGAGIHRCVASHFARAEMKIGVEEFHRLIPEYRLASTSEIQERGVVLALNSVALEWDV